MKELNNHLLLLAQLVVSVGAAFVTGYLLPYFFYGIENVETRLIVGILFAFVVGVADLYFVIRDGIHQIVVLSRVTKVMQVFWDSLLEVCE